MCPKFILRKTLCKTKGENLKIFDDGICRLTTSHLPNQRVCPIGLVLCPDLSCRETHDECFLTPKLKDKEIRCIGQDIVTDVENCPSTITCTNIDDVVCPDGSCVDNEIYCPALNKCFGDYPYRCSNNVCATDYDTCNKGVACGHKVSLCSDYVCRETC